MTEANAARDLLCPLPVQVSNVARETHDTYTITTIAAAAETLPPFLPGQFRMLYEYGVGEVPISISGDPETRDSLVYTIRSVGKATHALVSHKPGDYIGIRGAFGTSWPIDACRGRDVLLVAGGIGLAPLRPVISHIEHHRSDYGRFVLLYGARSPRELLFRKQLSAWQRMPETEVLVTVDCADSRWAGHVGVVTRLLNLVSLKPERTTTMMCGPEIMMRFVVRELLARNFDRNNVYLSMERSMQCAVGFCGHCQLGPDFICKDGPVFAYSQLDRWMENRHEL